MKTKKLLVFIAACMLLVACEKEKEEEPTLAVSENTITFPKSNAGWHNIEVTSNVTWDVTVDATWCSFYPRAEGGIGVTVEPNPLVTERTATITIQARALQEKITVIQEAGDATLSVSSNLHSSETNAAGSYAINVTSNVAWETRVEFIYDPGWVFQDKTWCVLEPSSGVGSGVITINLPQNTTNFRRSAIITISSGSIVRKETIIQHGVPIEGKGVTINGLTWATSNVEGSGAFAYSSQDPGKYYQFNRMWGYSYIAGKIEPEYDGTDRSGDWLLINDPSPEGWRLPTAEEMENLRTSGYRWVSEDKGAWFGPDAQTATFWESGNAVFLPASGNLWLGNIQHGEGHYWTKGNSSVGYLQPLHFGVWGSADVITPPNGVSTSQGYSIRCVKE